MKQLIFSVLIIGLLAGCRNSRESLERHIVAHACSAIDGHRYTNSKEALYQAIQAGITYIEIDLVLTSDSMPVGCHSWEFYHEMIADTSCTKGAVEYSQFTKSLLYGYLHPVTFEDILDIWNAYPELILITDKISDPEILGKFFLEIKDRMIVECFSLSDYFTLSEKGFKVLLSDCPILPFFIKYIIESLRLYKKIRIPHNYVFSANAGRMAFPFMAGEQFAIFNPDIPITRKMADDIFSIDQRIKYVYVDDIQH